MATYKIQKGDTLGAIAKKYGVSTSDISGYKSGDPNKIYEGETVSIGSNKKDTTDYASEVKNQLNETTEDEGGDNTETSYGIEKVKTDYDTYKTNREKAYKDLKNVSDETFETEYSKKGLDEKKQKIEQLDSDIATAKATRDEAISKVRSNPGLSASQMTGDIKKLSDYQNNIINNLVSERNSVADEYNTGLEEVNTAVERTMSDKQLDYNYWNDLLDEAQSTIDEYTKSYSEELESDQEQSNWEKELAQALQIAQMRNEDSSDGSSAKLQLVRDENTGDPLYYFNPDTGEITYINGDKTGGTDEFGDIQDELDTTTEETKTENKTPWWRLLLNI